MPIKNIKASKSKEPAEPVKSPKSNVNYMEIT
jgi:hypothetical protein